MEKKRILFLHGFLGSSEDMRPFFLEEHECHSINLKDYMKDKSKILKDFNGPYDLALGYSYGGRVLGKLLEKDLHYVKKPIFVSARLTAYTEEELKEREFLKNKLLGLSITEFYDYWDNLELFDDHSMKDYREHHNIPQTQWSLEEIHHYLNSEFTFDSQVELQKLRDKALYFYGDKDSKYRNEAKKMPLVSKSFNGGHRFLFQQVDAIKKELKAL